MLGTRNRIVTWPMVSSELLRDPRVADGRDSTRVDATWRPAALVSESDTGFTLQLDVPGVSVDSLAVDLDGELLTVAGERRAPDDEEGRSVVLSEMAWGAFQRRFRLGADVDRDGVTAAYRDGVLDIWVPKRQEARPRRIPVSNGA